MRKILVKTVPDEQQRYDTVGDYYTEKDGTRTFVVSDMHNWRYEMLVAVHELIESALCKHNDILDKDIDAFDIEFEKNRKPGDIKSMPGDVPEAPYHKEHLFATKIEKMLAEELGVGWKTYDSACQNLTSK